MKMYDCDIFMDKGARHRHVLRLLAMETVRTQDELRRLLAREGVRVDQPTLSRDLKELGVARIRDTSGNRYRPMNGAGLPSRARVLKAESSGNLVVLHTAIGDASPVALLVDKLAWPELLGTVAGDDTILAVVRPGVRAQTVAHRLLKEGFV